MTRNYLLRALSLDAFNNPFFQQKDETSNTPSNLGQEYKLKTIRNPLSLRNIFVYFYLIEILKDPNNILR